MDEPKLDCDGERGDKKRGVIGVPTGVESRELCGEAVGGELRNTRGGGTFFRTMRGGGVGNKERGKLPSLASTELIEGA